MKRISILLLSFVLIFSNLAKADEGMWFLAFLNKNYSQMQALGFKLTVEDIYSINKSSLKDAVVALDHGSCTGEIVSNQGLLFTNHHCGYGEIQAHSTVDHDYLKDGFWAASLEDELPNPGKTVSFLIRMEDVTAKVLANVNDNMSETMRDAYITRTIDGIIADVTDGTNYDAEVQSMYEGNAYYLFIYQTFKDVRLVGAPPSSIGKYGGDTDNWMWPRHTGDFSIFRVYTAPDGSPAEYSPDNIPLVPKTFLKVNIQGVKENDFTMIMGYPGTTNRYLSAAEVEEVIEHENTIRYDVRTIKLDILKKYMDADPNVKIQYAAKYAQSANYWKYSWGQNLGLNNLKVVKRKKKLQKDLMKWVKADNARMTKYGDMFNIIQTAVEQHEVADIAQNYWFESIYLGSEIISFTLSNFGLYRTLQGGEQAEIDSMVTVMTEKADEFFKDFDPKVDKELFITLGKIYLDKVKEEYYPSIYEDVQDEYNSDWAKYADAIYSSSIFVDKDRYMNWLKNPSADVFSEDIGFNYSYSMLQAYWAISDVKDDIDKDYQKGRRLFLDAYMKWLAANNPDQLFYPDANSTLRLTYGTVGGYTYDNIKYNYFTTIDEYMAKEDPNNPEFEVTQRMKDLYKANDWGRYADDDGTLHIDFLTNNDITGGNSGSPVLNANGELIGLAFDGNWEGMSGDIAFEPEFQKTICVDVRYVLWVIDQYAGAKNLIDELTIIE
ncbi:MAG: S46 family peptidase [Bacteroidales bacterium]|nr:S46 family peptidase [Bacteroidales bacterium]